MTVLEQLVVAAAADTEWAGMIADQADNTPESPRCDDWGRKGGSHYKDGEFTKK